MSSPTPPPPNRRRTSRKKPKSSTKVFTCKGMMGLGANLALSILDLSETGIRLLMKEPLAKGQEVEITLEGIQHRRPLKLGGHVIWTVPAADGRHCIAVHFLRSLSYADVLLLSVT